MKYKRFCAKIFSGVLATGVLICCISCDSSSKDGNKSTSNPSRVKERNIHSLQDRESGSESGPEKEKPEDVREYTLSEKIKNKDIVLHGWGQSWSRWRTDGFEYLKTMDNRPVLISDYVSFRRLRRDPDATKSLSEMSTWKDPHGKTYRFILLETITIHHQKRQILKVLRKLGYSVDRTSKQKVRKLLKDPEIRKKVRRNILFPDEQVAQGKWDREIARLAEAVRKVKKPVLVRFMQEFVKGIHKHDVRSPATFKKAWIYFVRTMREKGANNAEFVWHPNKETDLSKWWPGKKYVDWVAVSVFSNDDFRKARKHSQFAEKHGKPFIIAESAPTQDRFEKKGTRDPDVWKEFFAPYFKMIRSQSNIKAFVYINIDWKDSKFDWPTSRIQANKKLLSRYKKELTRPIYVHNKKFWETVGK